MTTSLPATAPAIGFYQGLPISDPASLSDITVDVVAPEGHDLLVEVEAVSVNPVDLKVRGAAPASSEPKVIGFDAAGVVVAVGPQVSNFSVGDPVWYAGSIARPGSNTRYQLVNSNVVGRRPRSLTAAQAAAMPLTTITAWEGLFDHLGLTAESSGVLLVIGAAGGVGSMVIQLAKQLTGLTVIAVASREDSAAWVRQLGADQVVGRDFGDVIAGNGVDYVYSSFTPPNLDGIAKVIKPRGHIVCIDTSVPGIDALKPKSVTWHWEYMFTRPVSLPDDDYQHRLLTEVADLVDAGRLRSTLTQTLAPLDAATLRQAHEMVESSTMIGKVVVTGWPQGA